MSAQDVRFDLKIRMYVCMYELRLVYVAAGVA